MTIPLRPRRPRSSMQMELYLPEFTAYGTYFYVWRQRHLQDDPGRRTYNGDRSSIAGTDLLVLRRISSRESSTLTGRFGSSFNMTPWIGNQSNPSAA